MAVVTTVLHQSAGVAFLGTPPVQTDHSNLGMKVLKLAYWCLLATAKLKSIVVGP
jgi:hypothetical protein